MSGHLAVVPARVVVDPRVGSAGLRVLLILGSHTDKQGWCRVKQDTIADLLRIGRQAVSKQVVALSQLGYVEAKRTGRSSVYRVVLDVPEAAAMPPEGASEDCPIPPEVASDAPLGVASDAPSRGRIYRTTVSNDVPERESKASRAEPLPSFAPAETFERFWSAYPRKTAKGAARTVWPRALRSASVEVIVAGAERFAADPNREESFTPHASTWLNGERWNDPPLPPRPEARHANGHRPSVGDQNLARLRSLPAAEPRSLGR